uniref:Uncharacterized protein n=1 Tax=Oryza barthii TaxID=65489 RepID=A0A0D3HM44_9ORYZ
MALPIKLLLVSAFLSLLLLIQGAAARSSPAAGKCAAASVEVEQANTGEKAGYDPVFEVTVRNRCACAVRGVRLRSEGFASYLVGDGRRIEPSAAVTFRYAWDRAFRMAPAALLDDCS